MKKLTQITTIVLLVITSMLITPSKAKATDNGNGPGKHDGGTTMPINNGLVFLTIAGIVGGVVVLRDKHQLVKA